MLQNDRLAKATPHNHHQSEAGTLIQNPILKVSAWIFLLSATGCSTTSVSPQRADLRANSCIRDIDGRCDQTSNLVAGMLCTRMPSRNNFNPVFFCSNDGIPGFSVSLSNIQSAGWKLDPVVPVVDVLTFSAIGNYRNPRPTFILVKE